MALSFSVPALENTVQRSIALMSVLAFRCVTRRSAGFLTFTHVNPPPPQCYCYPVGVTTDPNVGACDSSARLSEPVAGILVGSGTFQLRAQKPNTEYTIIQFSNVGGANQYIQSVYIASYYDA